MGLQKFEGRLERLVDGSLSKAFRSDLHPVEVGRRLTREMDLQRRVGVNGLVAPNSFVIYLSTSDYNRMENFLDALVQELEVAAREHADTEHYSFMGPVTVVLAEDVNQRRGRFSIVSEMVEGPTRAGSAALVAVDGQRFVLGVDPVVIGRLPECGVPLADANASRRHAEVRLQGNDVILTDLGSTNGTRVNGRPVHQRVLEHGDEILIGTTALRFELS